MAQAIANSAPATQEQDVRINYSDFNSASFEGRVLFVEEVTNNGQQWIKVSVASVLKDGTDGVTLTFNDSNGIFGLYQKGYLPVGRRVHLTGSISDFRSHYVDRDGLVLPLKKPQMHLVGVSLKLGALPKSAQAAA